MIPASKPDAIKTKAGWRAGVSSDADIGHGSDLHPTPVMRLLRHLAGWGMACAGWGLDRYALATDSPEPGIVEAADLLDAARAALAGSP